MEKASSSLINLHLNPCLLSTSAGLGAGRSSSGEDAVRVVQRAGELTTITPVTAPPCSGPSKSPATLCNQYYECLPQWWWWAPTLQTCPDGQVFDQTINDCSTVGSGRCALSPATTIAPQVPTTLTAAPVTPPTCTGAGNYPGPDCTQYYQCVYVLWWWDFALLTCPVGQGFDAGTGQCGVVANCS